MSDATVLLAAIKADPDDRDLRLVYADHVAETDPLGACLLRIVADPDTDTWRQQYAQEAKATDPARAEFIRVQCELEQQEYSQCRYECKNRQDYRCNLCLLRHREADGLATYRDRWLRVPCGKCTKARHTYVVQVTTAHGEQAVTDCPACRGTGDAGGLTWKLLLEGRGAVEQSLEVTFRRGFPDVVTVPRLTDAVASVPQDPRRGLDARMDYTTPPPLLQPTPWLAAVVKHHPTVTHVVALDKRPHVLAAGTAFWDVAYSDPLSSSEVPTCLFEGQMRTYTTDAAAIAALGLGVVRWAKRHVSRGQ